MDLKEVLKLADDIVFAKTGQHLDDLQAAVLQGTLQRETYKQIAKDFDCSESRIREIGSELWQILSEDLGEDVNKKNFRSAMERWQVSNVSNFAKDAVGIGIFNICGEARHPPNVPKILQQNSRLITITGGLGIGKTSLAIQLVQQIKDDFEYVVWCNLDTSPTLPEFEANLIQFFSQSAKQDSPTTNQKALPLIKYLQKHRCLVVLDDIHNLFSSSELAGKYKPGYEEYRSLFKHIEKLSHQSCFLLIGWEPPKEVPQLTSENTPIRILQLAGLDTAAAREILRDKGLTEIENCETLIHRYQGNP
ncbi:MAG: ATP-binding protein, partial [Microcoleus sp. PH2017_03_ELD_O_A]|nr:ATP-binding protein [Microcoleus sp. PH2017_03_ELD_O_A]